MDESWEDPPTVASTPPPPARYYFQFSLWQIMALTLAVSVIAAWLRLIPYREEYLWAYLLYFGSLAAYVILRIPLITGELLRARREAVRKKEEAIAYAEEVRRRKRAGEGE